MYDIALGVSYLHTRRPSIIHRDLKSMNILISSNQRAKINDFGLARIRPTAKATMHTQCGTPNWQAPEFWCPQPRYTEKVDVYSCGLIFWEILQWANEPFPYYDLTEHQLYIKVRDEYYRPSMKNIIHYPRSLLLLIEEMWHPQPTKRPSMMMVVERLNEFLS
jgi:serine/threonine protein kinase